MIMRAEKGYKITQEEVREQTEVLMQKGTLRDFNQDYWARFIKDGVLDKDALVKAGYDGPGEADNIEAKMITLGWLPGAKEVTQFVGDPAYVGNEPPLSERKQAELAAAAQAAKSKAPESKPEPEKEKGKKAKE